jgi:small subunit ribosomal protein S8
MSMSDPIADMLTRIRNAQLSEKQSVAMPFEQVKVAIAKVLKDEGYIEDFAVRDERGKPQLEISLKYYAGSPVIERSSGSAGRGCASTSRAATFPQVMNGLGVAIVSTSKGVMTDRKARGLGSRRRSAVHRGLTGAEHVRDSENPVDPAGKAGSR